MKKAKKQLKIEELLPGVKKNVFLKNYTTFRIGGRARYFFEAKDEDDLISAISAAKKTRTPFFILGGGSNMLVSDKGFNGLVIKTQNVKYGIRDEKITAGAGTRLGELARAAKNKGLAGLEWAAGIPGTLGGALRGNAGAFKSAMADSVQRVDVLDTKNGKMKIFKNKDCRFAYRDSIFKKNKNLVIVSSTLKLKRGDRREIENKIKEFLKYRQDRQALNFACAGSVFLNPKGRFAGELIEECGLKGKKIGRAQISKIHANFIVNLGGARAKDVRKLINLTKGRVKRKFGIALKEEISYL
jgi:UDP-N-acetylmuramate dehydrogenase